MLNKWRYISNAKKINMGRQIEYDLAKSAAIVFMITIHVYERLSVCNVDVFPDDSFRVIIEFLGSTPAAPLFMVCMGIGIVYSRNNQPKNLFIRGLKLLLWGYLLNFFKGTLPTFIAVIIDPNSIIMPLEATFFYVDILQFAGYSHILIALLKKAKINSLLMLIISIFLNIFSCIVQNISIESVALQYVFSPFFPTCYYTSFPLFNWLFYPLLGIIIGNMLIRTKDKQQFYSKLLILGLVGLTITLIIICLYNFDILYLFCVAEKKYYFQNLLHWLFHGSILMILFVIYYMLSIIINRKSMISKIEFLSKNLTKIYIIQWIIICYSLGITVLVYIPQLPEYLIIPAALIILLFCIFICKVYNFIKIKLRLKH